MQAFFVVEGRLGTRLLERGPKRVVKVDHVAMDLNLKTARKG